MATMLFSIIQRSLVACLGMSLVALPLGAQGPTLRAFAGTVKDEQGQPLEGALVRFQGLDITIVHREVETDKNGEFYYGGFPPGRYRVTILRGNEVLWSHEIVLPYIRDVHLDINLKELREAAERLRRLDPELERRREEDRRQREQEEKLREHYRRGARYLEQGEPENALEEYEAARAMQPDDGSVYALLAAAQAAAGRLEEAEALYQRALELEPLEASHYNNLGIVLVRQGRLDEALGHFDRAADLDEDHSAAFQFNRGAALLNAGRAPEALAYLREATRRDPTLAVAHYFLGLALLRTSPTVPTESGRERFEPRSGTLEAFRRYLQLAPDGDYAEAARAHLERFGALPPQLLPSTPSPEVID